MRDVGMVQRRERLRFACESCQAIGVTREGVGQDLQRDVAIELQVTGAIDLSHTPFAKERGDLVDAEAGARSEAQM